MRIEKTNYVYLSVGVKTVYLLKPSEDFLNIYFEIVC